MPSLPLFGASRQLRRGRLGVHSYSSPAARPPILPRRATPCGHHSHPTTFLPRLLEGRPPSCPALEAPRCAFVSRTACSVIVGARGPTPELTSSRDINIFHGTVFALNLVFSAF